MENKITKTTTQVNLILLLVQILIIVSVWRALPPEIPLFYSRPWGKDQLAYAPEIIALPAVSLIILFINLVIARLSPKDEGLIKQMLILSSLAFTLLIFISLVQIIRLIS